METGTPKRELLNEIETAVRAAQHRLDFLVGDSHNDDKGRPEAARELKREIRRIIDAAQQLRDAGFGTESDDE